MNLEPIYLVLGALSFWGIVAAVTLVGSVYLAETWKDHTQRREIGNVIDPFTRAQTDRIARTYSERSIG